MINTPCRTLTRLLEMRHHQSDEADNAGKGHEAGGGKGGKCENDNAEAADIDAERVRGVFFGQKRVKTVSEDKTRPDRNDRAGNADAEIAPACQSQTDLAPKFYPVLSSFPALVDVVQRQLRRCVQQASR